ncbi:adenylate/guanylate cyclase domain-containing protein [Bradyrhizobium canariense]|uniref:TolB amino-terminal domain-containing protein n=1 Tax=Bradyrhizobium canariense TaxID=255045 RepID=A0A1H1VMM5_9BRAD|nr:adenylate/guanylate cyclase domain-containing protein [Bradyrhizobium canariense]SDS86184.1 TolB amino-terminal domain-containing protein [Bradyrhizobium canariense]
MIFSDTKTFVTGDRVERRLAAILVADVAGYSRLMHTSEEATHARVTALLTNTVLPAISGHGGRVIKSTGDGFLAEFPSAVDAVRAAMQFQGGVYKLAIPDAPDERILFRVGIHIGDIIVGTQDIFGDGVNIAARLEGIAEPGGICLSSSVFDQVHGKIGIEFADLGARDLKNIARPIRAYAVVPDGSSATTPNGGVMPAPLSAPRFSIVVLPFVNIGDDPEQEYFVDGVIESLTTDLSRIYGSFVIARNTAFAFKGKSPDVRQIGRELNVRYVLEGSVQRNGNRLRINVQLIDAETGNHLWAERFDKPLADFFDMQDEIVSRLANALDAQLIEAEARRAGRSPHPDAMDLYFQGRAYWNKGMTPEYLTQAMDFFERALALDAGHVDAMVGWATVVASIAGSFASDDRAAQLAAAETTLTKVLSMAPRHAWAHLTLGAVQMFTNRAAQGIGECERALTLDHNLADAHACIGMGKYFAGRAEETEAHILEALRLSPRDVHAYRWMQFVGIAKAQLGADIEAVSWLRRSIEANRNFPLAHFHLAEALALLGQLDEARAAAKAGLALQPDFTLRRYRMNALSDNPAYLAGRARSAEGMRLAGVPEG